MLKGPLRNSHWGLDGTLRVVLLRWSLVVLLSSVLVQAQSSSLEVLRAEQSLNEIRGQFNAGLVPRQKLDDAEQNLTDAKDGELISRVHAVGDLTEDQASDLKAAAQRRLDRRTAAVEKQRQLVDVGAAPQQTMTDLVREASWAQAQYDLTITRVELVQSLAEMARAEQATQEQQLSGLGDSAAPPAVGSAPPPVERFAGSHGFRPNDFSRIETAFEKQFHKTLPVSANGQTAVHSAMGFDHHNRIDIALAPDTAEGVWLRQYLESSGIPYYAFRTAISGKATGAHIHIGPPSTKL